MRPDPGLQTHADAIHLVSFVRGAVAAGTHCGLLLAVSAEDLSGRETCPECFRRWVETDDARDWAEAEAKAARGEAEATTATASRRASVLRPPKS